MNNRELNQTVLSVFITLAISSFVVAGLAQFVINTERENLDDVCIAEYGSGSYVVKTGKFGDPLCFSDRDRQLMGFPPSKD